MSENQKSEASDAGNHGKGGKAEQATAADAVERPAADDSKVGRRPPLVSPAARPAAVTAGDARSLDDRLNTRAARSGAPLVKACTATNDAISALLPQWAPDWAPRLVISATTIALVLLCARHRAAPRPPLRLATTATSRDRCEPAARTSAACVPTLLPSPRAA